ncbi:MAG: hypothetical protein IKU13_06525 [Clostridia bacterium]|nr:hypothetical protein [Clostridia bacterium]
MPNLADYSLADINKFNLLGDFPQDFKNACSSADLELSLVFSEANSNGKAISIEDFNLSERLLTATYKFQLTALMANRTISANKPGNFGLYGYLEEMASHFDKGENLDELAKVRLFVGCIQNSIDFMKTEFPHFAMKNKLKDAVSVVVNEAIDDAKKYYDHAIKVFDGFFVKTTGEDVNTSEAFSSKVLDSISHYDAFLIAYSDSDSFVQELHASFNAHNVLSCDKSVSEKVNAFEKDIIITDSLEGLFPRSYYFHQLLSAEGFITEDGIIDDYAGYLAERYWELHKHSLDRINSSDELPARIIETERLISCISYILARLKFEDTHRVFLANYAGMKPKLGNPPDSYIKRLLTYYTDFHNDYLAMQNRFMEQYVYSFDHISDKAKAEYAAHFGAQPSAVERVRNEELSVPSYAESVKSSSPSKTTTTAEKPKTTVASTKPKTTEKPVRRPEDEKKMRDLLASIAYIMADDASVTDKQRNEYIDNLVSYAADTSNADTSIDLSEKALLIGRKSHYKCDLSIKNLINRLKYKNCITNDNRPSGTLAGTLGNAYASCTSDSKKSEYVGSSSIYISSAIAIVLCALFIGYIWFVNYENVQWLGTRNMTKLFVCAGVAIISGLLTVNATFILSNLITTGVVITAGAIITSVLDFSTIAQDRTILTVSALIFAFRAFVSMAMNTRGSIEGAKRKNAENAAKLKDNIAGNIQYANAMIESLESVRASNSDASVLIEYYKAIKKAFESIKI